MSDARNFPLNTCPASRHAQLIGESLIAGRPLTDGNLAHCGESILATVAALYEARTERDKLRELVCHVNQLTRADAVSPGAFAEAWKAVRAHLGETK